MHSLEVGYFIALCYLMNRPISNSKKTILGDYNPAGANYRMLNSIKNFHVMLLKIKETKSSFKFDQTPRGEYV